MKAGWLMGLVLCGLGLGSAGAQVSFYADGSASQMSNTRTSKTAGGATFGVQAEVVSHPVLKLYGDLRGFYYTGKDVEGGTNNLNIGGVLVGPKVGFRVKRIEPYAEAMVGFARYNDGLGTSVSSTTDSEVALNFGFDARVSKRFDWRVFEFSYAQFYFNNGEFNPKTLSSGVVFHLSKR